MSNSTAVAATIGVGALGVLAYYGFQNMNGSDETVDADKLYNELDNNNNENDETKDFQQQAKEEVSKVVKGAQTAWGKFWKSEYDDISEKKKTAIDTGQSNEDIDVSMYK